MFCFLKVTRLHRYGSFYSSASQALRCALGHAMASVKYIPPYDSEYPGYLWLLPLMQTGTQSSTPQTPQIGYRLTEVMMR